MDHYEKFTSDDGVHEQYAELRATLPCYQKDLYYVDWLKNVVRLNIANSNNRYVMYTRDGDRINPYELERFIKEGRIDPDKVLILDCKLSDYDEWYTGYQCMVKLDLSSSMFKHMCDEGRTYDLSRPYKNGVWPR